MACRYHPALRGVVLSHSDMHFLDDVGRLKADSPFAVVNIGFNAVVWSPEIGMQLGRCPFCTFPLESELIRILRIQLAQLTYVHRIIFPSLFIELSMSQSRDITFQLMNGSLNTYLWRMI